MARIDLNTVFKLRGHGGITMTLRCAPPSAPPQRGSGRPPNGLSLPNRHHFPGTSLARSPSDSPVLTFWSVLEPISRSSRTSMSTSNSWLLDSIGASSQQPAAGSRQPFGRAPSRRGHRDRLDGTATVCGSLLPAFTKAEINSSGDEMRTRKNAVEGEDPASLGDPGGLGEDAIQYVQVTDRRVAQPPVVPAASPNMLSARNVRSVAMRGRVQRLSNVRRPKPTAFLQHANIPRSHQ